MRVMGAACAAALLLLGCAGDRPEPRAGEALEALQSLAPTPEAAPGPDRKEDAAARKDRDEGRRARPGAQASASAEPEQEAFTAGGGGAQEPLAAAPIPAGSYVYDTDGRTSLSGSERPLPSSTTLTADPARSSVQRQVRDLRDAEGNGTVTETRFAYRPDGVYLAYVKVTSRFPGGLTDVREFVPGEPKLISPAGAGPGFHTSFTLQGSGTTARFDIRALKSQRIRVGGERVVAVVVATEVIFRGAIEGRQDALSWFWPEHLLLLREEVHTDVSSGAIRVRTDYEAILTSLAPR